MVVPGLSDVSVESVGSNERLVQFVFGHGQPVDAEAASDGTLRALGVLTAAYALLPGEILCIDEVENGVFPDDGVPTLIERLGWLVTRDHDQQDRQKRVFLPRQFLVSSHSTVATDVRIVEGPGQAKFVYLDTVARIGHGRRSRVTRVRTFDQSGTRSGDRSAVSPDELRRFRPLVGDT